MVSLDDAHPFLYLFAAFSNLKVSLSYTPVESRMVYNKVDKFELRRHRHTSFR